MSKETRTHKLANCVPPAKPLTLAARQPFWHPDAMDRACGDREELFLEEAVGLVLNSSSGAELPVPFEVRFDEKTGNNHQWILGNPLPDPAAASFFSKLLLDLAALARKYNAALYTLRRIKYYYDLRNDGVHGYPAQNKNSTDKPHEVLLSATDNELIQLCQEAEKVWVERVKTLNSFLDSSSPEFMAPSKYGDLEINAADMVEVNNYIVSMRINVLPKPMNQGGELIGSSSHVSITSALSSPSP